MVKDITSWKITRVSFKDRHNMVVEGCKSLSKDELNLILRLMGMEAIRINSTGRVRKKYPKTRFSKARRLSTSLKRFLVRLSDQGDEGKEWGADKV